MVHKFQVSPWTPGQGKSHWMAFQTDYSMPLKLMVGQLSPMTAFIKDTLSMSLLVTNYWKEPNVA